MCPDHQHGVDDLSKAAAAVVRDRWNALFNRRPYLYTWQRRPWTVTSPWNYHLPFRKRLLISLRWQLPRWLGGWLAR